MKILPILAVALIIPVYALCLLAALCATAWYAVTGEDTSDMLKGAPSKRPGIS